MSRRLSTPVLHAFAFYFCGAIGLQAQTVTWTGLGFDDYNDTPANWLGNTLPLNNGTEEFIFGPSARSSVLFELDVDARKVSIVGNTMSYYLDDDYGTLTIRADGLFYAPATPITSFLRAYPVIVPVNQTWNIQSGTLEVPYTIEGAGQVTKSGAGTLVIADAQNDTWTGGLNLAQGTAVIHSDYYANLGFYYYPLGNGPLIFAGGTLATRPNRYNDDDSPVNLENSIVSNGLISTINESELHFAAGGGVTLNANTTIESRGAPLHIMGVVIEASAGRKLTLNSDGAVVLHGSSGWTGGTDITKGALIFAGEDNTPGASRGILVGTQGYAGISLDQNVGNFIGQINLASTGAIGFDSDPDLGTDTFIDPVDLSAFAPASPIRLGSATSAILGSAAVITPQGTSYRFGGGGGKLEVQSALTDAAGPVVRNVVLDSPAEVPLTVRFTNPGNSLTGGVSATHSAAVFTPAALPGAGSLTLGTGGYIGVESINIIDATNPAQDFINRFAATTDRGMIGFDEPGEHVTVSASISLAGFSDASPGIYLGTASRAVFNGPITPQGTTYRFGAYQGGYLDVQTVLSGAGHAVHLGDPSSLGTMGDFMAGEYSTVRLSGDNTHGGTTTLYTGRLDLGHANALGTGALIVQPHSLALPAGEEDVRPELTADYGLTIANAIDLNADLNIGGGESGFTLSGPIAGVGELYLEGDYSDLTLSGNNGSFSGGIYVSGYNSSLTLGSNSAAGTGPLGFGGGSSPAVYFATLAPVIGSLMSKEASDYADLYAQQTNTVLTINQTIDSRFFGYFHSSATLPADNLRIVKDGSGILRLDDGGFAFQHGTVEASIAGSPEVVLEVKQGTLIIGSGFSTDNTLPAVFWVNGGTLAVDEGNNINNRVVVGPDSRLAGFGSFNFTAIGTGAILSPGLEQIGHIGFLEFDHLELNAGGIFDWQIQHTGQFGGHDLVHVGLDAGLETLFINAGTTVDDPLTTGVNEDTRFTLRVISLTPSGAPGLLDGFDPTVGYSWALISYDAISLAAGFATSKFKLDTSGFANSLVGGPAGMGAFYLTDTGSSIMLNFAPVPEPSTYALLALGLGFLGLTAWRKSRRSF